jgi:hypothetical protein
MKRIRTLVLAEQQCESGALIAQSMFDDAAGDRLIYLMSLYRSIALHCLGATNPAVGDIYNLRLSEGVYGSIPYVQYPLYDDISKMEEIERGSPKAIFDEPDRDEAIRFMSLKEHRDALEFCYDCFVRLLRISTALADEIGIEPEVTTITEAEIIEATMTKDGETRRYKKNKDTDRLEEY